MVDTSFKNMHVSKDMYQVLSKIENRNNITKSEAASIRRTALKDGQIDQSEEQLLNALISDTGKIRVNVVNEANFPPSAMVFSPIKKEARFPIDHLLQLGGKDFEDIESSDDMTTKAKVGLAADIVGIIDPSPLSDGVSGAISLSDGDYTGAALSAASMFPYFGDAAAKPVKLLAKISKEFPHLLRFVKSVDDVPVLLKTLDKLGDAKKSPTKIVQTLNAMNNMHKVAAKAYKKNSQWATAAKKYDLPIDGPIPFAPPKNWNHKSPLKTQDNKGFIDAFGNEWRKGPSRTKGETFEWDVIPQNKNSGLANLSRDGSHVNVSLKGVVTHR